MGKPNIPKISDDSKHSARLAAMLGGGARSSQSQKFIDKARELGADESERAFDDKLRRVAKRKPAEKPKKEKPAD